MMTIENAPITKRHSLTSFSGRFHIWYDFQRNSARDSIRVTNQDDKFTADFFNQFIGPRNSLLDCNLANLYRLFSKNDVHPNKLMEFVMGCLEDSSYYLKLGYDNNDNNIFRSQFVEFSKRKFLTYFLAELAVFGSSINEEAVELKALLDKLNKSGFLLTDNEIDDTKKRYFIKQEERVFIGEFLTLIEEYSQDNVSPTDIWQHVHEYLQSVEQDNNKPYPCPRFYPRLEFLLMLVKLQGADCNTDTLMTVLKQQYMTYALALYQNQHNITVTTKNLIENKLQERGYTTITQSLIFPAKESDNLLLKLLLNQQNNEKKLQTELIEKNDSVGIAAEETKEAISILSRIKKFAINVVVGIKNAVFAVGRLLGNVFSWLFLSPFKRVNIQSGIVKPAVKIDKAEVSLSDQKSSIAMEKDSSYQNNPQTTLDNTIDSSGSVPTTESSNDEKKQKERIISGEFNKKYEEPVTNGNDPVTKESLYYQKSSVATNKHGFYQNSPRPTLNNTVDNSGSVQKYSRYTL